MSEIKISIKAARVNAGFTIVEASKRLGISPSTLVAWEKKPEKISAANQDKIASVYGISTDNIIFLPRI